MPGESGARQRALHGVQRPDVRGRDCLANGRPHKRHETSAASCMGLASTCTSGSNVENTPWLNTPQIPAIDRMEIKDVFARNLRAIRRARGLSQEELAHRAGIDRTYVSSLERSIYSASIDVVDRLAKELDVDVCELLKRPAGPARKNRTGSG